MEAGERAARRDVALEAIDRRIQVTEDSGDRLDSFVRLACRGIQRPGLGDLAGNHGVDEWPRALDQQVRVLLDVGPVGRHAVGSQGHARVRRTGILGGQPAAPSRTRGSTSAGRDKDQDSEPEGGPSELDHGGLLRDGKGSGGGRGVAGTVLDAGTGPGVHGEASIEPGHAVFGPSADPVGPPDFVFEDVADPLCVTMNVVGPAGKWSDLGSQPARQMTRRRPEAPGRRRGGPVVTDVAAETPCGRSETAIESPRPAKRPDSCVVASQ